MKGKDMLRLLLISFTILVFSHSYGQNYDSLFVKPLGISYVEENSLRGGAFGILTILTSEKELCFYITNPGNNIGSFLALIDLEKNLTGEYPKLVYLTKRSKLIKMKILKRPELVLVLKNKAKVEIKDFKP